MHTPSSTELDAIFAALDYNDETNELIWLKATRRLSEGTPAGTLNRAGRLIVGFNGRKYPAANLAWFFHFDEWPEHPIKFRDGDPTNLRHINLIPAPLKFSDSPKARQMRRYRAKVKANRVDPLDKSELDDVMLMLDGTWTVRVRGDRRKEIATLATKAEAEALALAVDAGLRFLDKHPAEPYKPTPTILAGKGKGVLTLADARDLFAYDPDTGAFYHRYGAWRRGVPAVQYNDRNRPFLRASGRQYPAGMMAWFITHGVWPKRKQIGYRDHNPKNTALGNLYLKDISDAA